MDQNIRQFYDALFDLIGLINQPQRDSALLQEAGISLDRALFPLLVLIGRRDAVGIMELAGLIGRDHTHGQPSGCDSRPSGVGDATCWDERWTGTQGGGYPGRASNSECPGCSTREVGATHSLAMEGTGLEDLRLVPPSIC